MLVRKYPNKEYPSKEYLDKIFRYDAESGLLYNKVQKHGRKRNAPAGNLHKATGYLQVMIKRKNYKIHRIIWIMVNGSIDGDMEIDHIDHNGANNKLENLRLVMHGENLRNQRMPKNNTSGHAGIGWNKEKRKWYAKITVKGKRIHLGYFENMKDAVKAREAAEIKYGFHKNHGKTLEINMFGNL